jgi:hypothetical protein
VRLFDALRGPHWTLLGPNAPELGPWARTVRGPAPHPYGPGLFLVRPDGYVGWAGNSTAELTAYLTRLGLIS